MTREDFGWHDDRPCPEWCTSTDHHLQWRLEHRTDHFWHKGPVTRIPTEDEDHNCHRLIAELYLSQHVIVDERGFNTRPAEVSADGGTFTPDNARLLAATLIEVADQAERA